MVNDVMRHTFALNENNPIGKMLNGLFQKLFGE
jgi:hypothetical protein